MEQEHELDRWLDDALASYKVPAPRPGLEPRTLAHVRSAAERRRPWGKWALAGGTLMALVVAAVLLRTSPRPAPIVGRVPQQGLAATVTRVPVPAVAVQQRPAQVRVIAPQIVAAKAEPRLSVFPAPLPLTAEERAWVGLARRSPETLTQLAREQAPIDPIVIPEIKIQSLEPTDQNSSGGKK